jgi:hypothetical protein
MFLRAGAALGLLAFGGLGASAAWSLEPGQRVDDFRLLSQTGESHELYYRSDMKAVVLVAQGNACRQMRAAVAAIKSMRDTLADPGVDFLMINSNRGDSRVDVAQQAEKLGIDIPVLMDETQLIGESLDLAGNGEALVIDPKTWRLVFRGSLAADSGQAATAAVFALLRGQAAPTSGASAAARSDAAGGCAIRLPERNAHKAHARISYAKTIAPMLIDHCVTCHRSGGIGPWPMSSYAMVYGFAPMIREVVRTQRMPPWHADPHYLPFKNDRSLSNEQVKTLVHWVEAGAPRGVGPDPLAEYHREWPEWQLGEPDLIVEIPPFDVPATGVLPYRNVSVPCELDHDVWVRAIDFKPGDRRVVHHIIASVGARDAAPLGESATEVVDVSASPRARVRRVRGRETNLGNYVPGAEPLQIPPESGILLEKGSSFHFQMHYTPNGVQTVDATRMGLYFMKSPPQYHYRAAVLANPRLRIPANTKVYADTATYTFRSDALVYTLHAHAHFRGRSARFVAQYPDGREQVLLSVPRYDFNWQSTYELHKPIVLPAGTRIVYTSVYDNSSQNKANPDPNRVVPWGQQTWDEMLYGVIRYRGLQKDAQAPQPGAED